MEGASDLVQDFKLNTCFPENYVCHIYNESNPIEGRRIVERLEYWRREKHLGSGGFGTVWLEKCTNGRQDIQVRAVKDIQRPRGKLNCLRELEALARFSHVQYARWFVKSYGWYEEGNTFHLAMEYFPLGDLQSYLIQSEQPLPEPDVQQITLQILEGLNFMHERGFVHRDVKPGNMLLQSHPPHGWWVKISDFGLSKKLRDFSGVSSSVKGTTAFMAPELHGFTVPCEATSPFTPTAVDMWALGAMTHLLLTKQHIFSGLVYDLLQWAQNPENIPSTSLQKYNVTTTACSFIQAAITVAPHQRLTAEKGLQHQWMQSIPSENPSSLKSSSQALHQNVGMSSKDEITIKLSQTVIHHPHTPPIPTVNNEQKICTRDSHVKHEQRSRSVDFRDLPSHYLPFGDNENRSSHSESTTPFPSFEKHTQNSTQDSRNMNVDGEMKQPTTKDTLSSTLLAPLSALSHISENSATIKLRPSSRNVLTTTPNTPERTKSEDGEHTLLLYQQHPILVTQYGVGNPFYGKRAWQTRVFSYRRKPHLFSPCTSSYHLWFSMYSAPHEKSFSPAIIFGRRTGTSWIWHLWPRANEIHTTFMSGDVLEIWKDFAASTEMLEPRLPWAVITSYLRGQHSEHFAISPDLRLLAFDDQVPVNGMARITVVNVRTGREYAKISYAPFQRMSKQGHPVTGSTAMAFSPDGRKLAFANVHSTLMVWNTRSKSPEDHFYGFSRSFLFLAFSHDSTLIAGIDSSMGVTIWDLRTRHRIDFQSALEFSKSRINLHVCGLAFLPDYRLMALVENLSVPEPAVYEIASHADISEIYNNELALTNSCLALQVAHPVPRRPGLLVTKVYG